MPRTREQLDQAAAEAEAWLDQLDPDTTVEDVADLRAIINAVKGVAGAQADLDTAVLSARAVGRSWGVIALALGISRQAARQRYEEHAPR
ncbi:MAG: sigma-70 family RNA polymerase sigma factor [Acidimicrobiia bacterium]